MAICLSTHFNSNLRHYKNTKCAHNRHLEIDRSFTQPTGLVYSIGYDASHSKQVNLLGLKMALHIGKHVYGTHALSYVCSWLVKQFTGLAQLVEQLLLIPEVSDSNPVIGINLYWTFYRQLCFEKTKIKKKRPGMAHLKKQFTGYS